MNEKERQIFELIQGNPYITQNELAQKLQLSRPAVANYISSLMKKGYIVGRAYIVKEDGKIVCLGGANVDKKMVIQGKMQMYTSNPVKSYKTAGGVARNVAENLGRLGVNVSLITAFGDDSEGKWLLEESERWMDITPSWTVPNASTGNYTAVLSNEGEMILALADMDIYDQVDFSFIDSRWNFIGSSSYVFLDTNFPKETIEKTIERCNQENIRLCVNLVSAPKAKKLPDELHGITLLIANRDEVEAITGFNLEIQLEEAVSQLLKRGVEQMIITFGKEGVRYFSQSEGSGHLPAPNVDVKDVTGAGDSLASGVLYALNKQKDLKTACRYGLASSYITLQSNDTVARELNGAYLEKIYTELFEKND
ncbi:carbohydrate kinase [Fervidibacillus halotolerans]|uniref:Winged helix-turn-helix transcriptional regulator n=1 Tax=Fervidibacillus halotolerans TaxID=2980027 RepID=A0A9E8M0G2_9BACI|nr:carbohydrate kinase [Fervidibacillus halotolerans]WAA13120.1 winged helix-turn-helix transcriptional regulator [Fervidibacillus halotolerans]